MNAQNINLDAGTWQQRYSAGASQWQDALRIAETVLVIAFLLLIATLYAFGYAITRFEAWLFNTPNQFFFYLLLVRMFLVALTPFIFMVVCLRFIFKQARALIQNIYQIPSNENIPALIRRRLWGVLPLPPPLNAVVKYPAIVINNPELEESHTARWLGGPALLVLYDGFAAYLERGNQFSRVVGPSFPPPLLERYERIKEIVDLRPQNRKGYVEPWTKDGIQIKLQITIVVQIDASMEVKEKANDVRYPFDPLAVKQAVEYTSMRITKDKLEEQNWVDGAWGSISGAINKFVAGHSLDELFTAPQTENHVNNHVNHETPENVEQIFSKRISEQVVGEVRERLAHNGIHVLNIQITHLEIPQEVLQLRTRYWASVRDKISAQRDSRAEGDHIRAREEAHAEAQRTMLTTIMTRLGNVEATDLTESLILSLSGILDQNLEDPIIRPLIAKESFAVLDRVKKLLHEGF